jgi:hypothetical protein
MEYDLTTYQRTAAQEIIGLLRDSGYDWRERNRKSSFALSAITGAGKTVIATAVIEATFFGSADFGVDPDPAATFLWVTDDPALNRQTINKMNAASDLLEPKHLKIIDDGFLDRELTPGRVHFINIQKLSKGARLTQSGTNLRQSSFWDILANTVANRSTTLYVIRDEAHRGIKRSADRTPIMHRIIHGDPGSNPAVPVVWGISATIKNFTDAMGELVDRTMFPHVQVDIDEVRNSGLVKDEIGLEQPEDTGTFSTTLLRDAVRATLDYETRWHDYRTANPGEKEVLPILVVQVPDKASPKKLAEMVSTITDAWPDLEPDGIAHVFGEHESITLAGRTIRWERPESIEFETSIRVVLAKTAISTGWDCPRAEVLYSERPAKDATHIAQIIGRMVRQPLAHRVETDDALNSVTCYLPLFDRDALGAIKDELEGKGKANGSGKVAPSVVRSPKVFGRNPEIGSDVFDLIESLPSIPTPDPLASPLRRAKNLAALLVDDASGNAMLAGAGAALTKTLMSKLDGLAAEHAEQVDAIEEDLRSAETSRTSTTITGQELSVTARTLATHHEDLERDARRIVTSIKEGVGLDYLRHLARKDPDTDPIDLKVTAAALFRVPGVVAALDQAATAWVHTHLERYAVEIRNTTGATREAFRRVQEQSASPEVLTPELRPNEKAATRDRNGHALVTVDRHLFSDEDGRFPLDGNDWEQTVVRTELDRPSTVAWYRNPSRAASNTLRIAYQDEGERWRSLQVDFLIVSAKDDGQLAVAIVDPHGDHLADARAKLLALADYAEHHGDRFVRIESISKTDAGDLRVLDLKDEVVRDAVRAFDGGRVTPLYDHQVSRLYI